ncbi:hypothetical protein BKA62DRAFT_618751 [Auriculariales sp. MPI-PUGE-AT-0066]|nr:hypothetical protein BKA62DRAFT_618751 [Auriculariales sp. MPI-PUGE-AT-0066]
MSHTVSRLLAEAELEPQNAQPRAETRYINFANTNENLGLNNLLQELLLLSEVARQSHRALVLRPFQLDEGTMPPQVFFAGPITGGAFPEGDASPRAVSMRTWERECPPSEVYYVRVAAVDAIAGLSETGDGIQVLEGWARWLGDLDQRCVEIAHAEPSVFDFPLLISSRVISIWPTISSSPLTTAFRWSSIVAGAVEKGVRLIGAPATSNGVFETLAALHIRRGDFGRHCQILEDETYSYNTWNLLPSLPDGFDPQANQTHENYQRHCWPTMETILLRIEDATRGRGIQQLYILSNSNDQWLAQLVAKLRQGGWDKVLTSHEMKPLLVDEETLVDTAVDMEIARRAKLFIGNGFSSVTSNIVMLRLAMDNGSDPSSIRFW